MTLLRLDALGKDFGATVALRALTCEVRAGEVVGLLGPNGSGKTTTMKLLMGMLRPSRGSARFDDLDCTHDARRVKERIGYTPEEPAFYDFLTGRETIGFVLDVRGLGARHEGAWARLGPLVEATDFGAQLDVATGGYSHGTKKKLALLLAMAHQPTLLLLDEPTNGLDPPTAVRVRAMLRDYATAGGAVVVSTHLLAMAEQLCDRVLVLHKGEMIADGTSSDVKARAGVGPDASLEDAFLELVK
jgi:ABC-2 type transport system ATP-binding protein